MPQSFNLRVRIVLFRVQQPHPSWVSFSAAVVDGPDSETNMRDDEVVLEAQAEAEEDE